MKRQKPHCLSQNGYHEYQAMKPTRINLNTRGSGSPVTALLAIQDMDETAGLVVAPNLTHSSRRSRSTVLLVEHGMLDIMITIAAKQMTAG
jgi:hypothetical protein